MNKTIYYIVKAIGIIITAVMAAVSVICAYLLYCNLSGMEVPRLGPYRMYVVLSDSMAPMMRAEDAIITCETAAGKLEVGDVITFTAFESETVITHRITGKEKTAAGHEFSTKGDNNNAGDNFMTPEERVIGKQVLVLPQFGGLVKALGERPYIVAVPVAVLMAFQFLLGVLESSLRPKKKIPLPEVLVPAVVFEPIGGMDESESNSGGA